MEASDITPSKQSDMNSIQQFLWISILMECVRHEECQRGKHWRIMHGEVAEWKKYKFMAFLYYEESIPILDDIVIPFPYVCAGTLISPRWVLTAAHCIPEKAGVRMNIVLGHESNVPNIILNNDDKFYISDFQVVHKDYIQSELLLNDIGLVKITGQISNFTQRSTQYQVTLSENITTVRLSNRHIPPGKHCRVAGWGYVNATIADPATDERTALSWGNKTFDPEHRLFDVDTEVSDHQSCTGIHKYYWLWHPEEAKNIIWTKSLKNNTFAGPMEGDSGGALVCDGEQAGLVSGGIMYRDFACDQYTRTEAYLHWIEQVMARYDKSSGRKSGTVLRFAERRAASTILGCNSILNTIVILYFCLNYDIK